MPLGRPPSFRGLGGEGLGVDHADAVVVARADPDRLRRGVNSTCSTACRAQVHDFCVVVSMTCTRW